MEYEMEKDRKIKRRNLKVSLQVFDGKTDQLVGYLVDITDGGIMLTSEQLLETEVTFQLKLTLSEEIEGSKEFGFSAITKWCQKDTEFDFYNVGFQFSELTPTDEKIVKQLIDKFCFGISSKDNGSKD